MAWGQTPRRFGVVMPAARMELEQEWNGSNPDQKERGFCAEYEVVVHHDGHREYRVTAVHFAKAYYANQYSVGFECPRGQVKGHVHTPTTCRVELLRGVVPGSCRIGGPDAYICRPSPTDQTNLDTDEVRRPFAVVQCDRDAIVFYFPRERGGE